MKLRQTKALTQWANLIDSGRAAALQNGSNDVAAARGRFAGTLDGHEPNK
jgi:phosphate/sulfate permease